jgi:hypothetical protein
MFFSKAKEREAQYESAMEKNKPPKIGEKPKDEKDKKGFIGKLLEYGTILFAGLKGILSKIPDMLGSILSGALKSITEIFSIKNIMSVMGIASNALSGIFRVAALVVANPVFLGLLALGTAAAMLSYMRGDYDANKKEYQDLAKKKQLTGSLSDEEEERLKKLNNPAIRSATINETGYDPIKNVLRNDKPSTEKIAQEQREESKKQLNPQYATELLKAGPAVYTLEKYTKEQLEAVAAGKKEPTKEMVISPPVLGEGSGRGGQGGATAEELAAYRESQATASPPASNPTAVPAPAPISAPISNSTAVPAPAPISAPISAPVSNPTAVPAPAPISAPISNPTAVPAPAPPISAPVSKPTAVPAPAPISAPVSKPTAVPAPSPISAPVSKPTASAPIAIPKVSDENQRISMTESTGNYNVTNGDRIIKEGKDKGKYTNQAATATGKSLTDMTLEEVQEYQKGRLNNGQTTAVGKYQVVKKTLFGNSKEPGLVPRLLKEDPTLNPKTTKFDPKIQERLQDMLLGDNKKYLAKVGFELTPGNLKMAHYLGADGAMDVLRAAKKTPDMIVADAVKAGGHSVGPKEQNPELYTTKVKDFIPLMEERMRTPANSTDKKIADFSNTPSNKGQTLTTASNDVKSTRDSAMAKKPETVVITQPTQQVANKQNSGVPIAFADTFDSEFIKVMSRTWGG